MKQCFHNYWIVLETKGRNKTSQFEAEAVKTVL